MIPMVPHRALEAKNFSKTPGLAQNELAFESA